MSEPTVNEQIQQYIKDLKSGLLTLIDDIDKWLEILENMARILKADVDIGKYRNYVKKIEDKIRELYDNIVAYEDHVDKNLANSWLGQLMDLENLWGELVVQSAKVGDSTKNVANGCIPEFTKLKLPNSWRETKTTFGKGSNLF